MGFSLIWICGNLIREGTYYPGFRMEVRIATQNQGDGRATGSALIWVRKAFAQTRSPAPETGFLPTCTRKDELG